MTGESTAASNSEKGQLLESFKASGANIFHGSLEDHASLVEAVKNVDVVISTVGSLQIETQVNIIKAIKEVRMVKRFFPSEFGNHFDNINAVDPKKSVFHVKAKTRREIEASDIPYTYISNNCFAGFFLPNHGHAGLTAPPRDKVVILGDENAKVVVYVKEEDIGNFTIKEMDDTINLNKTLYFRLPASTLSFNELVAMWEKKTDKTLEKVYVPKEGILKLIVETPFPANISIKIGRSIFVKGDQTNFEIGPNGVEVGQLYPDVKYTTVDEYLNKFM